MKAITDDRAFKAALQELNAVQQRTLAAKFVEHVLPLSKDDRLDRVVKTASDRDSSQDELSAAMKSAKAATIDSHTRCGSEGNWEDQAGYFVARAAIATVTPAAQSKAGGPAWQAAMNSRMARTSKLIDTESGTELHEESEWQYQTLTDYLQD